MTDEDKEKYGDFVFDGSTTVKIETALCAADILIADYSSLIFEYSLLNKPMLFYAYDLEEYEHDRSFYFDYKSFVPGKIVINNDEIISAIQKMIFVKTEFRLLGKNLWVPVTDAAQPELQSMR